MPEKPGFIDNFQIFMRRVNELWGLHKVVTSAPALANMDIGELWLGDGSESSPDAGSNALYFKVDAGKIIVIAVANGGGSTATRHIT